MSPLTRNNNNCRLSILEDMFDGWSDIFSNRDFLEARGSHNPIVKQLDDRFEVSLAAPGIEKKDFTITVEGDDLTTRTINPIKTIAPVTTPTIANAFARLRLFESYADLFDRIGGASYAASVKKPCMF